LEGLGIRPDFPRIHLFLS